MSVGRSKTTGEAVEIRVQSPRLAKLISGEMSVEDLDDEELARGYPKDKGGKFRGRPPSVIPKELHDRMVRELIKRGQAMFNQEFHDAIRTLAFIANDPRVNFADRYKAAVYLIERVAGKVPDKLELSAEDPWQTIINKIVVDAPEEVPIKKEPRQDTELARQVKKGQE